MLLTPRYTATEIILLTNPLKPALICSLSLLHIPGPCTYKPVSDVPSSQEGGQQMKHGYPVQRNLLRTAQQSWKLLSTIAHRESLISCPRRRSASRCRHRLPTVVPEESRSTFGSHCQLTIVIIPTSPREALKLSK